jgi:hypothetical protein
LLIGVRADNRILQNAGLGIRIGANPGHEGRRQRRSCSSNEEAENKKDKEMKNAYQLKKTGKPVVVA